MGQEYVQLAGSDTKMVVYMYIRSVPVHDIQTSKSKRTELGGTGKPMLVDKTDLGCG